MAWSLIQILKPHVHRSSVFIYLCIIHSFDREELVYDSSRERHIPKHFLRGSFAIQSLVWVIPVSCWIGKRQAPRTATRWHKNSMRGCKYSVVAVLTTRLVCRTSEQVWKKLNRGLMDFGRVSHKSYITLFLLRNIHT
jgi:hypothetical protein